MNATQMAAVTRGMGFVADPVIPPIPDLLKGIVEGLKALGDKGLSGAKADATQRHLAGVLSMIKSEASQNAVADKINNNNDAQAKLDAEKAALNKNVQGAGAGSLGALA